jgi:hypothetical protein
MIRVVCQCAPNLFTISLVDEANLEPTFMHDGTTYYRAETHHHYVLYKAAVSGWGAGKPGDTREPFDRAQR